MEHGSTRSSSHVTAGLVARVVYLAVPHVIVHDWAVPRLPAAVRRRPQLDGAPVIERRRQQKNEGAAGVAGL